MNKKRSLKTLPLDGGSLPFHFINTVYAWRGENLHEYLNNYDEVLEWCLKVKALPVNLLNKLEEFAAKHTQKKQQAFEETKRTRLLLYRFFSGIAGRNMEAAILKQYNTILHRALTHFEWHLGKKMPHYILKEDATNLLLPLWVVVEAAHQLLFEADFERIKECPRCGWIFLDKTKNNKRRWCNPSTCGSVEKMYRYYRKIKNRKLMKTGNLKKGDAVSMARYDGD